jgi:hypothetical protein
MDPMVTSKNTSWFGGGWCHSTDDAIEDGVEDG